MQTLRNAFPYLAIFFLMVALTLIVDGVLHLAGMTDWGRHLGYWGTLLLLISFVYSARKRKLLTRGKPLLYLRLHEFLAWLGAMMILVHGGIHFNALLPWLAMAAMLVAVASGLAGKYLLKNSKAVVGRQRKALLIQGLSEVEIEDRLHWDALMVEMMKKWRSIHLPITSLFAFLALLHVISILVFWKW